MAAGRSRVPPTASTNCGSQFASRRACRGRAASASRSSTGPRSAPPSSSSTSTTAARSKASWRGRSRTIGEVAGARVHIAMAKASLFVGQRPAGQGVGRPEAAQQPPAGGRRPSTASPAWSRPASSRCGPSRSSSSTTSAGRCRKPRERRRSRRRRAARAPAADRARPVDARRRTARADRRRRPRARQRQRAARTPTSRGRDRGALGSDAGRAQPADVDRHRRDAAGGASLRRAASPARARTCRPSADDAGRRRGDAATDAADAGAAHVVRDDELRGQQDRRATASQPRGEIARCRWRSSSTTSARGDGRRPTAPGDAAAASRGAHGRDAEDPRPRRRGGRPRRRARRSADRREHRVRGDAGRRGRGRRRRRGSGSGRRCSKRLRILGIVLRRRRWRCSASIRPMVQASLLAAAGCRRAPARRSPPARRRRTAADGAGSRSRDGRGSSAPRRRAPRCRC